MLTRPTEHAICAMTFLAKQPPGKLSGAREIATAERIPSPFLWKILHTLARNKLVRSFRGVHGGYELARPAKQITLAELLVAMGETEVLQGCLLGFRECDKRVPCPLHPVEEKLRALLKRTTLANLVHAPQQVSGKKRSFDRPPGASR